LAIVSQYRPQIAYRLAICPRGNHSYIQITSIVLTYSQSSNYIVGTYLSWRKSPYIQITSIVLPLRRANMYSTLWSPQTFTGYHSRISLTLSNDRDRGRPPEGTTDMARELFHLTCRYPLPLTTCESLAHFPSSPQDHVRSQIVTLVFVR